MSDSFVIYEMISSPSNFSKMVGSSLGANSVRLGPSPLVSNDVFTGEKVDCELLFVGFLLHLVLACIGLQLHFKSVDFVCWALGVALLLMVSVGSVEYVIQRAEIIGRTFVFFGWRSLVVFLFVCNFFSCFFFDAPSIKTNSVTGGGLSVTARQKLTLVQDFYLILNHCHSIVRKHMILLCF